MPVSYRCPNPDCGATLKTPLRAPEGKAVGCPKCGTRFVAEPSSGVIVAPGSRPGAVPGSNQVLTRAQNSDDRNRLTSELPPLGLGAGDPVPGLSSWILERQLGCGGFGEVWLVKHEWNEERRAAKFFTHPDARHRLVTHEKKVLVRVMRYAGGHPNIVPLIECNLEADAPWLMYEYVPGGTLADSVREWLPRVPSKRLSKAVKALFNIAAAIGHCHRLGTPIVHRDLKPANVLRDNNGVLRVTDFGIGGAAVAHMEGDATRGFQTNSGRVPTLLRAAGSFGYSSPQQRNGEAPDPRDDVYALGVLAYQLLMCDLTAWPSPDMGHELRALGLPRGLIGLLVHSVSHNAARRPADAFEWKERLEALVTRSDSLPAPGIPTPAPGSLNVGTDSGMMPGIR
jgi:eukaryotic-like serine/threonine-protein kinase